MSVWHVAQKELDTHKCCTFCVLKSCNGFSVLEWKYSLEGVPSRSAAQTEDTYCTLGYNQNRQWNILNLYGYYLWVK